MLRRVLLTITAARPNPVFDAELRRWRLMGRFPDLLAFARYMVYGFPILIGVGWAALRIVTGWPSILSPEIVTALALLILGAMIAIDVAYVLITVSTFNAEMRQGQWDLLTLTPVPSERIYAAKFSVAQLRVFHFMVVETGLRTLCVWLFMLEIAFRLIQRWGGLYSVLLSNMLGVLIILPAVYFLIVEPFWRMRVMVAIGFAASARIEQEGFALFAALVGVFAVRAIQLGMVVGGALAFAFIATQGSGGAFLALCGAIPFLFFLPYAASFWLYNAARRRLLNSTYTYLFTPR